MTNKTYSIFGAGAAGLYTGWRLLGGKTTSEKNKSKQFAEGDTLELYDWGKYDFSKENPGTRAAGARVCTWHNQDDKKNSYPSTRAWTSSTIKKCSSTWSRPLCSPLIKWACSSQNNGGPIHRIPLFNTRRR
jgi:hypothetical protein